METTVVAIIVILALVTVLYQLLPHRIAGEKKPLIAFLPKYRKRVKHSLSKQQLEEKLAEYGFKKTAESDNTAKFTRGSILGDISIELAKVNVSLQALADNEHEIRVNAGWVAAFDTGDHWQFITELTDRIENA